VRQELAYLSIGDFGLIVLQHIHQRIERITPERVPIALIAPARKYEA